MINCFAEMVACGVKRLAISPPLSPEAYDALAPYSEQIVKGFGIASYLEKSLMVTLLQSPEFAQNKCSILYYKTEPALAAYLELKERQARLIASDGYDVDAQKELSVAFMRLLSYPSDVIASKLSGVHADPFILVDGAGKRG